LGRSKADFGLLQKIIFQAPHGRLEGKVLPGYGFHRWATRLATERAL
jgi:hypothetical protein